MISSSLDTDLKEVSLGGLSELSCWNKIKLGRGGKFKQGVQTQQTDKPYVLI